jgi:hypothetical protein
MKNERDQEAENEASGKRKIKAEIRTPDGDITRQSSEKRNLAGGQKKNPDKREEKAGAEQ